jgi:hypothetical protein
VKLMQFRADNIPFILFRSGKNQVHQTGDEEAYEPCIVVNCHKQLQGVRQNAYLAQEPRNNRQNTWRQVPPMLQTYNVESIIVVIC